MSGWRHEREHELRPRLFGVYTPRPRIVIANVQPGASLDYPIDIAEAPIAAHETLGDVVRHGDQITDLSLDIYPSGCGELTPDDITIDGLRVRVWMSGGVAARHYVLRLTVGMVSGRCFVIPVSVPMSGVIPMRPHPPPCWKFGMPVTWKCQARKTEEQQDISPLFWSDDTPIAQTPGDTMFGPAKNLPPYTIAATGTTQLTAAVVPFLADILINAASATGAGILIGVPAADWSGYRPRVTNESGAQVFIYLFSGDQFARLSANEGYQLEDQQSASFGVAQSGIVVPGN
jgi:hypothetical protein